MYVWLNIHAVELAKFSRESLDKIFTSHLNTLEMLKNIVDVEQRETKQTLARITDPKYVPKDSDDDVDEPIFVEDQIDRLNDALRDIKEATRHYEKLQYLYDQNEIYGKDDNSSISEDENLYN